MPTKYDLGTVLVVGGCGYLGSNLVKHLSTTTSSAIHVLSRKPNQASPNVTYHAGDITNHQQIIDLLEEISPKHHSYCRRKIYRFGRYTSAHEYRRYSNPQPKTRTFARLCIQVQIQQSSKHPE
ncbi:hypothetical protein OCU04_001624 [Sclerotinia nivalis]|uniref:NAD-dependent epimerase/dehydratase domain-containing protein n=1 Tax=Sclerotinia nivalis TaxID=352851 RepID=A0A9X0AZJ9_9HELO|nr:hypothetical protein OCU04_001624 [Sclerotinia nivalis]